LGKILNVLIVEDSESDALLIVRQLRKEGYEPVYERVETAAVMETALAGRNWDIIICDYVLPEFSGLDALKLLSEKALDIPCIITSGRIDEETAVAAMKAGARDYVMKSNLKRLGPAIERELEEANVRRERRDAEELNLQNEAKLSLVLEQMPCILWTTDDKLAVKSLLGAALAAFNYKLEPHSGLTISSLLNFAGADLHPMEAHRQALSGVRSTYELVVAGRNLLCFLEPLRKAAGGIEGVIGVALDVTDKRRAEEELRALSRRLVDVQETERRTIARELHDEIGQTLTVLKLMLSQIVRSSAPEAKRLVGEAQTVTTSLIQQVRELSLNLRPSMLDDLGLLPTLLWQTERFYNQTQVKVNFKHRGLNRQFSQDINTAVYRIIQEALTNVARYSKADEVSVDIDAGDEAIQLEISDKGCGFDSASLSAKASTGLSGMRERADLLGGKLSLLTAPGKGTRITVRLPTNT
jgi:two-component system, NarL family, sensor histidine kinase UhpB